jgi:cytochrome c oxidase assembly factor CtaG
MLPINTTVLLRELELSVRDYLNVIWRPIVATTLMAGGIWMIRSALDQPVSFLAQAGHLFASIAFGASAYIALAVILWLACRRTPGAEAAILALIKRKIAKGRTPSTAPLS